MSEFQQFIAVAGFVTLLLIWLIFGGAWDAADLLGWMAVVAYQHQRMRREERGLDDRLVHK